MAYGAKSSLQQSDSPEWGFVVFIVVISAIATAFGSVLLLLGNGTL
jgi:hypothetical protein